MWLFLIFYLNPSLFQFLFKLLKLIYLHCISRYCLWNNSPLHPSQNFLLKMKIPYLLFSKIAFIFMYLDIEYKRLPHPWIPMCQISHSILLWFWNKVLLTIWKFNQSAILPYHRQMVLFAWNCFLAIFSFAQNCINPNIIQCLIFT